MKLVFIAYNHKDKIIARFIYRRLKMENWKGLEIFLDEFSIKAGSDIKEQCLEKANLADLGIVVLSEYTQKSEYAPQEIGILLSRKIPKIYISLHPDWSIPPGYERTVKSFPLYEKADPFAGLSEIAHLVQEYLTLEQSSAIELINKAARLDNQGNFHESLQYCEQALLLDPKYELAHLGKTRNLRRLGLFDQALQAVDNALGFFPDHPNFLAQKAFVFYSAGRFKEAIETYDMVLAIAPSREPSLFYKGQSCEKLGRIEDALNCYQSILAINEDSKYGRRAKYSISQIERSRK